MPEQDERPNIVSLSRLKKLWRREVESQDHAFMGTKIGWPPSFARSGRRASRGLLDHSGAAHTFCLYGSVG